MDKNAWWKWILLLLLAVASLALIYPPSDQKDSEGRVIRPGRVRLGLDLRGGTSFVVEVDENELRQEIARDLAKEKGGEAPAPEEVEQRLRSAITHARDVGLEQIRNRVDGLGIAEPAIYPQGDARAVIQMPGIDAAKRDQARATIESVAFLEFRLVHEDSAAWVQEIFNARLVPRGFRIPDNFNPRDPYYVRDLSVPDAALDRAFWLELRRFPHPREGAEFFLQKDQAPAGAPHKWVYRPFYLETKVQLTGKAVRAAMVDYDQFGMPKVNLEFTREGRRQFTRVTRNYCPDGEMNRGKDGRLLAIVMDGRLYSAPRIKQEINQGTAEITGQFSREEAQRLVNVLMSGQLPAPMKIVEERTVAPTLGRDSIRSGVNAAIYGGAAVLAFMLIYYRFAGLVANLALALNLLLLPVGAIIVSGFMGVITRAEMGSGFDLPTLTLPGIAGIVLTLGMAVDANVLIYERIREEQKSGKHFLPAIDAGYDKAFTTILDSNLTTLIAAVIMFWQGSGPVRGYAVTLSAGILVSMYTAIVVTKMLFHTLVGRFGLKTLRMLEWVRGANFDFLKWRHAAYLLSSALLVASLAVFIVRGNGNLGVDFVGGTSLTIAYDTSAGRVPEGELRAALTAAGIRDTQIQYQEQRATLEGGRTGEILVVRVDAGAGEAAQAALLPRLEGRSPQVLQIENVGPQVGRELKRRGIVALFWAMVAMVIYISWRFEFGYAVGAIIALLHDAVISVGLFCLMGRQLSTPMIAVVLTIVGYSVNDTIVIFDRIREYRKLYRDRKLLDLANLSINSTLSRTLLTSGTTLLSVLALLIFGGGAINDFALLLLFGVIIGTYSTIFIATPIAVMWRHEAPATAPTAARPAAAAKP